MKKQKACKIFGRIVGNAQIAPDLPGAAGMEENDLGKIIAKTIIHLPYDFPFLKLHQFCVMPDHVHLLLQVLYRSERHLDFYIEALKEKIAKRYSNILNKTVTGDDIFEIGYCDKPLYDNLSLDGWYNYIRLNPHRLAMRQQYPRFFQRVRNLKIGNHEYEAYGNLFLFRNPDKEAVKISRKFSEEEKQNKISYWLDCASRGTILVSPFISAAEKSIRTKAESIGSNIILITHEVFPERFKPYAHDFELCSDGRLLIISLGLPAKTPISYAICQRMNKLALDISSL